MSDFKKTIKFKGVDGKFHIFITEPNPLNNDQTWRITPFHSMWCGSLRDAKNVIKDINKNCEVLEVHDGCNWNDARNQARGK